MLSIGGSDLSDEPLEDVISQRLSESLCTVNSSTLIVTAYISVRLLVGRNLCSPDEVEQTRKAAVSVEHLSKLIPMCKMSMTKVHQSTTNQHRPICRKLAAILLAS
jgi:hypothetical protein